MGMPLRVLIIEYSEDDAALLLKEIGQGAYEVESERVETRLTLEAALARGTWDIILCAYSLPQFSAGEAIALLKERELDIPLIVLSETIDEEAAITLLRAGAQDFLVKGKLARLIPVIERELRDAEARHARIRAEEKLQQMQDRFKALTENAPDGIALLDRAGHLKFVSPSARRIFGYGQDQDPDINPTEHTHPDDLPMVLSALADLIQNPLQNPTLQYRFRHKNGSWRWVESTFTNLLSVKSVEAIVINFRDISKRKGRELELEAVAAASTALRTAKSLEEMLPRMLDQALSLIQAEEGSLWLYDVSNGTVHLVFQRGWSDALGDPSVRLGEGIVGMAIETGEAIISPEFRTDPRVVPENREYIPEGVGGICLPLYTQDGTVGAMFVNVHLPREINSDEVRVLKALAEINGSAIHRMDLYEQTVRQLERLSALRIIDMTISNTMDLRVSLSIVLEQVASQLGVDATAVLLVKSAPQRLEFAIGRGFRTSKIESTSLGLGEDYPGQAALDKKIIHIQDLSKEHDLLTRQELLTHESFISYFAIPLIAKGEVKGIMELFHRSHLRVDTEWLNFLDSLSWQAALAVDNALLFEDLKRSNLEMAVAYEATLEGWSRALDLRNNEREGHTQRVADMTIDLARRFGVPDDELINIRRGALLHDIGKMGVPDHILLKPGPLTEDEWIMIRKHPQYAYDLLKPVAFLASAMDIPYCHHEKWDGTGYPGRLRGREIPQAARLFTIVDVWDALTSDRPYRPAWSREEALRYIRHQSGKQFDPKVVEVFLESIR